MRDSKNDIGIPQSLWIVRDVFASSELSYTGRTKSIYYSWLRFLILSFHCLFFPVIHVCLCRLKQGAQCDYVLDATHDCDDESATTMLPVAARD